MKEIIAEKSKSEKIMNWVSFVLFFTFMGGMIAILAVFLSKGAFDTFQIVICVIAITGFTIMFIKSAFSLFDSYRYPQEIMFIENSKLYIFKADPILLKDIEIVSAITVKTRTGSQTFGRIYIKTKDGKSLTVRHIENVKEVAQNIEKKKDECIQMWGNN